MSAPLLKLSGKLVARKIPTRSWASHKGDNGRVVVIGGSEKFVGAPALTALAALHTGADLAIVVAPERVAWAINTISPDLITVKLPVGWPTRSRLHELLEVVEKADSVVVGPGLGDQTRVREAIRFLLKKLEKSKVVIDADALKSVPRIPGEKEWVLTPHAGEFSQISGIPLKKNPEARIRVARRFASEVGAVILLKGPQDVVVAPNGRAAVNQTGNPGMTVGGTGDVLAGVVGALMAQGVGAFDAACSGAWICGRAGDLCLREKGYEFLASEVIKKIPEVFKELRR